MKKRTGRLLVLFLTLILSILSFTACGNNEPVPVEVGFGIINGFVPPEMYMKAFEHAVRIENNTYKVGQDIPITIYYGVFLSRRELDDESNLPINISLTNSKNDEKLIVKSYTPDEIFSEECKVVYNFETNKMEFKQSQKATIPSWWFAEEGGTISVTIGQEYNSNNAHNDGYGYVECILTLVYEISDGVVTFP